MNTPIEPTAAQAKTVLTRLRFAGPLCSSLIYISGNGITHRLGARIYDLKKLGHSIETRTCEHPNHVHESRMVEYVLGRRPEGVQGPIFGSFPDPVERFSDSLLRSGPE